jgi:hypothetical protein
LSLALEQFFRTVTYSGGASEDADGDGNTGEVDPDSDNDGLSDSCESLRLGTNPMSSDSDGDGTPDATDGDQNPSGFRGPLALANGPDIPGDKGTNPAAAPFDCDGGDSDADGRADTDEAGIGCGGAVTSVTTDIAYGDGDGTSQDTDGDRVPDGVECAAGTSPLVASSAHRTSCATFAADADADGDGVFDNWEKCAWNTSVADTNTDDDSFGDCRETFDVNGNGSITNGDAIFTAQAFFGIITGDLAAMDVNGNGMLSNGDAVIIRTRFFGAVPCVP